MIVWRQWQGKVFFPTTCCTNNQHQVINAENDNVCDSLLSSDLHLHAPLRLLLPTIRSSAHPDNIDGCKKK
ncbi:hypothetical protein DMENIID0001_064610 [Sergentomyia squamirostris]